jgi:HEPN domain-containing protein
MPPDRPKTGSSEDWLKRARSNLARAKLPKLEEALWEDYCFDAQQAAEKALKALLLFNKIPFRFVHDIAELLTLLEQNGFELPEEIRAGAELSEYAVEARYPSPMEPVTEQEYDEAIATSEQIVSWVTQNLANKKTSKR